MGPLSLWIHRWWWNLGIFTSSRADHGWSLCGAGDTCLWGAFFTSYSGWLIVPVLIGFIGTWRALLVVGLGPQRRAALLLLYVLLQVPAGVASYYIA